MRVWLALIAITALVALSIQAAHAHRLYVDWKVGEVEVKAYFGGGEPCRDAVVKVYDADTGGLVAEGRTDGEGRFSFEPIVGVTRYEVVVEAVHMPGHRARAVIDLAAGRVEAAEMPLYLRVLAGLGWLMGLAGAAMAYVGWRRGKSAGAPGGE